jgi:hypothetical protein
MTRHDRPGARDTLIRFRYVGPRERRRATQVERSQPGLFFAFVYNVAGVPVAARVLQALTIPPRTLIAPALALVILRISVALRFSAHDPHLSLAIRFGAGDSGAGCPP